MIKSVLATILTVAAFAGVMFAAVTVHWFTWIFLGVLGAIAAVLLSWLVFRFFREVVFWR